MRIFSVTKFSAPLLPLRDTLWVNFRCFSKVSELSTFSDPMRMCFAVIG